VVLFHNDGMVIGDLQNYMYFETIGVYFEFKGYSFSRFSKNIS
jgi:hypothetical protein